VLAAVVTVVVDIWMLCLWALPSQTTPPPPPPLRESDCVSNDCCSLSTDSSSLASCTHTHTHWLECVVEQSLTPHSTRGWVYGSDDLTNSVIVLKDNDQSTTSRANPTRLISLKGKENDNQNFFIARQTLSLNIDRAILSVHHVPAFYPNDLTYCHSFFTTR